METVNYHFSAETWGITPTSVSGDLCAPVRTALLHPEGLFSKMKITVWEEQIEGGRWGKLRLLLLVRTLHIEDRSRE